MRGLILLAVLVVSINALDLSQPGAMLGNMLGAACSKLCDADYVEECHAVVRCCCFREKRSLHKKNF